MAKQPPRWVHIQRCPRCIGQMYDVGSCSLCGNSGLLDENGDPYPPGQRIRELEAERDALRRALEGALAEANDRIALLDQVLPKVTAERDALRRAVEDVREWAEDEPREWTTPELSGYLEAKRNVRALLASAEIKAGRGGGNG